MIKKLSKHFDRQWQTSFDCLLKFVNREGHACVAKRHIEDGIKLGMWVAGQRHRKSTMPSERRNALEALPGWSWGPIEESWQKGFESLLRYVEREGHARVPTKHVEDGFKLGVWVSVQRTRKRQKKMSRQRYFVLNGIEGWSWNALKEKWPAALARLKKYADREGHSMVPMKHVEDGFKLGQWVHTQRRDKKKLHPRRVNALEAVRGWSWDFIGDGWKNAFVLLRRFAKREGHGRVPQKHMEEGFDLGQWVSVQRGRKRKMSTHRVKLLESIKGWTWAPYEDEWNDAFSMLKRFVDREGHALVPNNHLEKDFKLGIWVRSQRIRKKTMSRKHLKTLESLPGWSWNAAEQEWERAFEFLQRFAQREGHARVPQDHVEDGFKLGTWVSGQRLRKETMLQVRIESLESVRGWSWSFHDDLWNKNYDLLIEFSRREEHACVPSKYVEDGVKLGNWIARQRALFRKKELSEFRKK
ncbi:MAG: hypothetical protein GY847_41895 [Proteobacteria bacterium]|nr:hypothetical protein [Pseudomonadota bacterium]